MSNLITNRKTLLALGGVLLLGGLGLLSQQLTRPGAPSAGSSSELALAISPPGSTTALASTSFAVDLTRRGQPVSEASVSISLTMPEMWMPDNRFALHPVPGLAGHFEGEGVFTMKGKWDIEGIADVGSTSIRAHRPTEAN